MSILRRVFPTLGLILIVFSLSFMVPQAVAVLGHDGAENAFWLPAITTFFIGLVLLSPALIGGRIPELMPKDGILLVVLCWTLIPALACLPLVVYFGQTEEPISWSFAYFEAVSGLTTTGATVLNDLDALPYSINLWRCWLQWIGGMGILILAVAILPLVSSGAGAIFRAESTGPLKEAKLTPRIAQTAKGLWGVYCAISLACLLAYWAGGMGWADAWVHMFTTMSLGGLSSHDESFAHFNSPTLEWIAIFFMLIASGSFALYFVALMKRRAGIIFRDPEWLGSIGLMVFASMAIFAVLAANGTFSMSLDVYRMVLFNTVSIASTTGYATTDYTQWPIFAPILMLMLSGIATSAGSTGAGIKMARLVILVKQTRREIFKMLHPRAVSPLVINGDMVANKTVFAVLAFMLVYGGTIIALTFLLLLTNLSFDTAFSAIVACVNNAGPGLNEVGPAGNYAGLTDFQVSICSIAMILGRLEMMSFLAVFTVSFWRD